MADSTPKPERPRPQQPPPPAVIKCPNCEMESLTQQPSGAWRCVVCGYTETR